MPLHALSPAQLCFCMELLEDEPARSDEQPVSASMDPLTSPAMAAAATNDLGLFFIVSEGCPGMLWMSIADFPSSNVGLLAV